MKNKNKEIKKIIYYNDISRINDTIKNDLLEDLIEELIIYNPKLNNCKVEIEEIDNGHNIIINNYDKKIMLYVSSAGIFERDSSGYIYKVAISELINNDFTELFKLDKVALNILDKRIFKINLIKDDNKIKILGNDKVSISDLYQHLENKDHGCLIFDLLESLVNTHDKSEFYRMVRDLYININISNDILKIEMVLNKNNTLTILYYDGIVKVDNYVSTSNINDAHSYLIDILLKNKNISKEENIMERNNFKIVFDVDSYIDNKKGFVKGYSIIRKGQELSVINKLVNENLMKQIVDFIIAENIKLSDKIFYVTKLRERCFNVEIHSEEGSILSFIIRDNQLLKYNIISSSLEKIKLKDLKREIYKVFNLSKINNLSDKVFQTTIMSDKLISGKMSLSDLILNTKSKNVDRLVNDCIYAFNELSKIINLTKFTNNDLEIIISNFEENRLSVALYLKQNLILSMAQDGDKVVILRNGNEVISSCHIDMAHELILKELLENQIKKFI